MSDKILKVPSLELFAQGSSFNSEGSEDCRKHWLQSVSTCVGLCFVFAKKWFVK